LLKKAISLLDFYESTLNCCSVITNRSYNVFIYCLEFSACYCIFCLSSSSPYNLFSNSFVLCIYCFNLLSSSSLSVYNIRAYWSCSFNSLCIYALYADCKDFICLVFSSSCSRSICLYISICNNNDLLTVSTSIYSCFTFYWLVVDNVYSYRTRFFSLYNFLVKFNYLGNVFSQSLSATSVNYLSPILLYRSGETYLEGR
jgi:hypothetical protein